jgi:6-pyruvoyltetrahydropterin/6-carboxytetrahydropterin synthase
MYNLRGENTPSPHLFKEDIMLEEVMTLTRRGSFDSAHYLPNYIGKCKNMHGHHWVVELSVIGKKDVATGMVIDFSLMKKVLDIQLDKLDHKVLNDVGFQNPTAENIATFLKKKFQKSIRRQIGDRLLGVFVTVWETENSSVRV